jgi:hypothetical protein
MKLKGEAIVRSEIHPVRLSILEQKLSPPADGDPAW